MAKSKRRLKLRQRGGKAKTAVAIHAEAPGDDGEPRRLREENQSDASAQAPADGPQFPIVGVGASAGGLEAFTQLLSAMPTDPDMALILVQHLSPRHDSVL